VCVCVCVCVCERMCLCTCVHVYVGVFLVYARMAGDFICSLALNWQAFISMQQWVGAVET
jgi:hypothetical protein